MSTKKKQDSANEKKVSFFSFRQRFKGNVPSDPTSAEESGPSIAAEALLASTTTDAATGFDRPNSSKKGAARKVTKFFKAIKKSRSKTPKKDHLQPQPAISEQISANPLAVANQLIEKAITDVIPDSSDEQRQIAAIKIQALFRGHKEHVKYLQERKKIVKVEAVARGYLARKHVAELKGIATLAVPVGAASENHEPGTENTEELADVIMLN